LRPPRHGGADAQLLRGRAGRDQRRRSGRELSAIRHASDHVLPGLVVVGRRSEEHTSELQSRRDIVCRLLLEKKKVTGKRIAATEWLMDNSDWDFLMSVWVSVDRTQHCLSNYVGPDHPEYARNRKTARYDKVVDVYKQLDDAIGSFVSRTNEDDTILFISDHGFQSCSRAVNMDQLLRKQG